MIRHCVFIRFRAEISSAEKAAILADIAALQPLIEGLLHVHIGGNVSPEGLDRGYADGFIIDFTDVAARDAYLVHPDHEKAGSRIVAAAQGGLDGLLVYDFDIAG